MDHLDQEPVSWGVFPRVKAWTNEDVNIVKHEDRIRDDEGKVIVRGDFGELGVSEFRCLLNMYWVMF